MDQQIYKQAIKYLSIRMHTTGELQRKLKAKGFKDQDILPVLQKLEELKFLDDGRFAEIFVDNLKRYKDWGYYGVKAKLKDRQVPSDIATLALAEFYAIEDELAVAKRVVAKLERQNKNRDQIIRSLAAKGFRSEIVGKILDNRTSE